MFYLVRKSLIFYVFIFLLKMGSLQKTHYQGCSTPWIRKHLSNVSLIERRFFISSLPADAKRIAAAVRAHWLIENALHWTLDVVFNEDSSRVRKDHAGENMAIVRHIVVNMLSNAKKLFKNIGLKALRKKAGWGNETLGQILKQNF